MLRVSFGNEPIVNALVRKLHAMTDRKAVVPQKGSE